jgi:hypothetical protein
MTTVYIAVSGGWDHGVDECPEPVILTPETLTNELEAMLSEMVQFFGNDTDNVTPLEIEGRVEQLLEAVAEEEDTLFVKVKDAEEELLRLLREELEREGKLVSVSYWSGHEGSFYGIFKKEIP